MYCSEDNGWENCIDQETGKQFCCFYCPNKKSCIEIGFYCIHLENGMKTDECLNIEK